ncbi:PDC sensor domain-containing protein [Marinobacterium weihaiense]|uniref:PDC sensor domain-containing protein n=1 Tax=Marinobacterium weihaiense TaxID=2851016 RepID=A0ABS6M8X0_9GAMM|nr:PDC sensor domain-containing protein [Marinobacterium weihaiense]MBV0932724.1 PDC sensor domain-containing protein [Marinobacterium weihaiense]
MSALAEQLAQVEPEAARSLLEQRLQQAPDWTELAWVDCQGRVLQSTAAQRIGSQDLDADALRRGREAPFLHGPYVDPVTLQLGPRSSAFHDAVTLMFYQPIRHRGETRGLLVPGCPMMCWVT